MNDHESPSPTDVQNRRAFLRDGSLGIGSVALAWLLSQERAGATPKNVPKEKPTFDLGRKQSHFEPRAKAMISLFQHGGPAHMDLTDPKPELSKFDGKDYTGDVQYSFANAASKKANRFIQPTLLQPHPIYERILRLVDRIGSETATSTRSE